MIWNKHLKDVPEGAHAFLGASKHSWLNYSEDKLIESFKNEQAKLLGTRLHAFAKECIELRQKLPNTKKTLNMYVNDAIGFKMEAEQPLYYSENCFGTADSISFRKDILRIHDLKTGVSKVYMEQLYIYAALFCLEYKVKPGSILIETRIYQNNDILISNPEADDILPIMDKIILFDKIIDQIKEGEIR